MEINDIGGGSYEVTYTVIEGDTYRTDEEGLPVNFVLRDTAGNNSTAYTAGDPGGRPGVDADTPQIDNVVFEPTSGVLKVGDIATATIYAMDDEEGLASGTTMTINGIDVRDTFDVG